MKNLKKGKFQKVLLPNTVKNSWIKHFRFCTKIEETIILKVLLHR